jgi:hypothetical protein
MKKFFAFGCLPLLGLIGAWVVYVIAFHTIDPNFSAKIYRLPTGVCRLEIEPTFNVNYVCKVTVTTPSGKHFLYEADTSKKLPRPIIVDVPGSDPAGTPIQVDCELQYDRLAACIGVRRQMLVAP